MRGFPGFLVLWQEHVVEKELFDRAKAIQERILSLKDSL
jgi:hypothetical protein